VPHENLPGLFDSFLRLSFGKNKSKDIGKFVNTKIGEMSRTKRLRGFKLLTKFLFVQTAKLHSTNKKFDL
jgi:hypothetical protein